jgi:regulatory protein
LWILDCEFKHDILIVLVLLLRPWSSKSIIAAEVFYTFKLKSASRSHLIVVKKLKAEAGKRQAMNVAVRLLARRDHTRFEIRQKLRQRGFGSDDILAAVAECERLNYIDDRRTARVYIGQLVRRGFGFRRIAVELKKKGLQGKRIEDILEQQQSEIDEREIARRVLQKKIKSFEREVDRKKRRDKLYRFLDYRGFSRSLISELLREFTE